MKLVTDKCSAAFDHYLNNIEEEEFCIESYHGKYYDHYLSPSEVFKHLTASMQFGVLEDFFDSVGIYIGVNHNEVVHKFYFAISTKPMSNDIGSRHNLNRLEARKQAIEKANELYNNQPQN